MPSPLRYLLCGQLFHAVSFDCQQSYKEDLMIPIYRDEEVEAQEVQINPLSTVEMRFVP